jgi:hypothetical protein
MGLAAGESMPGLFHDTGCTGLDRRAPWLGHVAGVRARVRLWGRGNGRFAIACGGGFLIGADGFRASVLCLSRRRL